MRDSIVGEVFSDGTVALALADILGRRPESMRCLMRRWRKPILKVPIPGHCGRRPSKAMLDTAKDAVLRFLRSEEMLGSRSHVVKAFHVASGESALRFEWATARTRVRRAKLDFQHEIDSWEDCLAMASGDSNEESEIYVCPSRRVTLRALTSLLCHEAMHNFAKRTRRGNPWLAEEIEHLAMAMLGDPQLAS